MDTEAVRRYTEAFLEALDSAPTYVGGPGGTGLESAAIPETPVDIGSVLALLEREVDTAGINPASGGHLGYIPGGGLFWSALGDYLADISNRYAGVAFAGPGAVRLEKRLVRWMADMVGYAEGAAGDLTSGGSIANLMGIVAARDARGLKSRDIPDAVIYLTSQAHHCVHKAIRIAGLKECVLREIPLDAGYRMDPAALEAAVVEDKRAGRRPWLIVASAGTTDVGAVDPIEAIAEVARRLDLWLHVDAAYGGFFLLCDEGRTALGPLNAADSIVMDPHKGLFLPYGSGAVIVKDAAALLRAHHYEAAYMQDARGGDLSPADLSPELSRPFRGLRLWLPLQLGGVAAFRAALEEKLLLARYFHERLAGMPGFERGPYPELSVATYRYVPARGDADAFNRALVQAIHRDGRLFISSTMLDGRFVLRLAVLHYRTHRDTIDRLLDMLQREAARIAAG